MACHSRRDARWPPWHAHILPAVHAALAEASVLSSVPLHHCSLSLFAQEISLLKAISYDRNLVQFYGAVLNVEQPMLVRSHRLPSDDMHHCRSYSTSRAALLCSVSC